MDGAFGCGCVRLGGISGWMLRCLVVEGVEGCVDVARLWCRLPTCGERIAVLLDVRERRKQSVSDGCASDDGAYFAVVTTGR